MLFSKNSKDKAAEFERFLSDRFQNDLDEFLLSSDENFELGLRPTLDIPRSLNSKQTVSWQNDARKKYVFSVLSVCAVLFLAFVPYFSTLKKTDRPIVNVEENLISNVDVSDDANMYHLVRTCFTALNESSFAERHRSDFYEIASYFHDDWTPQEGEKNVVDAQLGRYFFPVPDLCGNKLNRVCYSDVQEDASLPLQQENSVNWGQCFDHSLVDGDSGMEVLLQAEPILLGIETIYFHQ